MNPISLESNHNPKNQLNVQMQNQSITEPHQQKTIIKKEEPLQVSPAINEKEIVSFYAEEIHKLNYMNTVITAQLSSAIEEKKIIMKLIQDAEKRQQGIKQEQKQKRFRKSAKQIERKFTCSHDGCQKSYGSLGTLMQHIKLKHPQLNSHDPPLMLDPC